jgi:hypothetical protein
MAKKTYKALTPIDHDGEAYAVDESIEMDEKQAAPLLAVNAIEAPPAKAEKAPAK